MLSPAALVLLFCVGRVAGVTTRFSPRLVASDEVIESKDDAEDTEEDLENAKGEEVVEVSESFSVSGLDVMEEDSDEHLVMLGRTEGAGSIDFSPPGLVKRFLVDNNATFVVQFCNWFMCAVAAIMEFPGPGLTAGVPGWGTTESAAPKGNRLNTCSSGSGSMVGRGSDWLGPV